MTAPQDRPDAVDGLLIDADGNRSTARWRVAEEAPLALLYDGEHFGTMMVTPRDLEDFALGFTLNEGIVAGADAVDDIRIEAGGRGYLANVKLADAMAERARDRRRSILAGSACGICGAQTVEAAVPRPPRVAGPWPDAAAIHGAFRGLIDAQPLHRDDRTTHAAAFADRDGTIVMAREDIGRHNALDKLGGALARAGVDPATGFAVLSSRLSVEMVVKAARIGVPFVASLSAPSGLALEKAAEASLGVAVRAGERLMVFGDGGDLGRS